MKKTLYTAFALLAAAAGISCEHEDIYSPVEFSATLDAANTYRAGDPVVFHFGGNADFITVWNGDAGHEYRHKDRELAPVEEFRTGELELKIYQQYGTKALEIYLTDRFEGLEGRGTGEHTAQDRARVQQIIDSGFEGWERFAFTDNTAARFEPFTADITRYVENFSMAIRLQSPAAPAATMRTYMINPRITTQFDRYGTYVRKFAQMTFIPFRMQGLWTQASPYVNSTAADLASIYKVNQNGLVKFRGQANAMPGADIAFQGFKSGTAVNASALPGVVYEPVDQWIFLQPEPLNKIAPDTGANIKGYADDVRTYTHTYTEPGTYTVTFIASTGNYAGQSGLIREMTVTVVDRIESGNL